MTAARLAVQPAQSSKAMRTSTTATTTTKDSVDPKASPPSSSPSPSNNSNKGKASSAPFTFTTAATTTPQPTMTTTTEQQQQQQALPLFTPIWDYDRFPIGPCVRENSRSSQEHDNPFLMLEYHQQNQRPQGNNVRNASAVMIRSSSSSSASSTASSPSTIQQQQRSNRHHHHHHGSNASRSSSRHGSRNLHINILGKSSEFAGSSSLSSPPSPSLAADPSNSNISPDLLFFQPPYEADLDQQQEEPNNVPIAPAPAPTSKFDLYKAQMDRVRSSHRLHMHGHGRSASSSTASPTTAVGEGQLPFPSTPSSLVYSPPTPSSPTTIFTPSSSSSSSSAPPSFVTSSNNNKKSLSQNGGSLFPKLFKKPSLSNKLRVRSPSASPIAQPPTSPAATTATSGTVGRNGSRSSLGNNNGERHPSPLSRRGSRSIATADPLHQQALQRSPLEEQQERWREEWLRPSGAISSMFRDTPSKFNCPHCGAIKVVSNIQFVPGLMSYLVAFGLMFLTLGTLSYLPFRRDHEGTKDCIHWCPECEQRVARYNRANSTWEWI